MSRQTGESIVNLPDADGDELAPTLEEELTARLAQITTENRVGTGRDDVRAQLVALAALGARQEQVINALGRYVMASQRAEGAWSRARMRSETEAEIKDALDDVLAGAKTTVMIVPALKVLLGL